MTRPKELSKRVQDQFLTQVRADHPKLWEAADGNHLPVSFEEDSASVTFCLPRTPDEKSSESVTLKTVVYYYRLVGREGRWVKHKD